MKDKLLKVLWPVIPFSFKKKLWSEIQSDYEFINETPNSIVIFELPEYRPGCKWTYPESKKLFNYSLLNPKTDGDFIMLLDLIMRQIEIKKIDFFESVDRSNGMILLNHVFIQAYKSANDLRYLNLALKIRDMIIHQIAPVRSNKYNNIYNQNCYLMSKAINSLQN